MVFAQSACDCLPGQGQLPDSICEPIVRVPVPQVQEQFFARCVAVPTLHNLKENVEVLSLVARAYFRKG